MRIVGTIANRPTTRTVNTKKDGPRIVHEAQVLDDDGGVVSLQRWNTPDNDSDPFAGLGTGDRIEARITGPSMYQGITRASLAELTKTP